MEQLIDEDFYKKLFRLLHSSKAEASAELKKICDDLAQMYDDKGITTYFPPIAGEQSQSFGDNVGAATSDITPTRKIERSIAPIRKDSLTATFDRTSLQSISPRPGLVSSAQKSSASTSSNGGEDQQQQLNLSSTSSGYETSANSSQESIKTEEENRLNIVETTDEHRNSENTAISQKSAEAEIQKTESSAVAKKRSADSRSKSAEDESKMPPEKKIKMEKDGEKGKNTTAGTESKKASAPHDDFDGLACVICKTFTICTDNLLVECHECHNMYHQKCHQPHVPHSQISDPRLLWYCHQCDKKLNRNRTDSPTAHSKSSNTSNASPSNVRRPTASSRDDKQSNNSDKKTASKKSGSSGGIDASTSKQAASAPKPWPAATPPNSKSNLISMAANFLAKHGQKATGASPPKPTALSPSGNPFAMALSTAASGAVGLGKLAAQQQPSNAMGGLSKLATTFQQQTKSPTSSLASPTVTPKPQMPTSTQMQAAAEKRLQMMKKKAASKGSLK